MTLEFCELPDLAGERVGGKVLFANDDFFAEKENLIKPGRGIFIPDKYTDRGKWMDGWESRRRRTPGHDFCVIKLGMSGVIRGVDIDTNHFLGNHPPHASIDACCYDDDVTVDFLLSGAAVWQPLLEKSPLDPGSQNLYAIENGARFTHLRLNIFPDGGVARLRVYGEVAVNWSALESDTLIDLAALKNGGRALLCSDMFFSHRDNLLMPGDAINMGDGWETKRRRGPGHDWVIIQLGHRGILDKVCLYTRHFKGNYPDRCSFDLIELREAPLDPAAWSTLEWRVGFGEQKLRADSEHIFDRSLLQSTAPVSHVRLNIFPDGGVSRLRIWGRIDRNEDISVLKK